MGVIDIWNPFNGSVSSHSICARKATNSRWATRDIAEGEQFLCPLTLINDVPKEITAIRRLRNIVMIKAGIETMRPAVRYSMAISPTSSTSQTLCEVRTSTYSGKRGRERCQRIG